MTSFLQDVWRFDTSTVAADPGAGKLRGDGSTTNLYFSELTKGSVDVSAQFAQVQMGDKIMLQEVADATNWWELQVSGIPTDNGTWWTIPIIRTQAGDMVNKNTDVLAGFWHPVPVEPLPPTEVEGEIALLRLYLADPTVDSEGNPITPFFSDEFLQEMLDKFGDDIYGAAAEGWVMKAAAAAELVNASTDNSTFSLSDVHKHCMAMVEYYGALSTSGGGGAFGAGILVNVGMTTDYKSSQDEEGDDIVG